MRSGSTRSMELSVTENQTFFRRAMDRILGNQKRRAIERRREKLEAEKDNAELELFLDDARANGLDPENPRDLAIIMCAWTMRCGEELPSDDDDMQRDHAEMDF
jgi:hypothetical protein